MGDYILSGKNIIKALGSKKILDNCNFEINKEEIVGIFGANGSGKTTLIKIILGYLRPNCGHLYGRDEYKYNPISVAAGLIETPMFYYSLSGADNLKYFLTEYSQEKAEYYADYLGLEKALYQKVGQYSLGMKQKLALILVLLQNRTLLVFDEPTNGLDIVAKKRFLQLIQEKVIQDKISVIITSHQLDELKSICTSAYFIRGGHISEKYNLNRDLTQYIISFYTLKDCHVAYERLKNYNVSLDEKRIIVSLDDERIISQIHSIISNLDVCEVKKNDSMLSDLYVKWENDNE